MNAKELIEQLQALPPKHQVLLPSDAEGNSFKAAYSVGEYFAHEEGYAYEIFDEEDEDFSGFNSVVIWPT